MDIDVRELYKALCCRSKRRAGFFGRHIYFLAKDDFGVFEKYFTRSRNILNRHVNLRSKHHFRHIHAIHIDGWISFHVDYANPDKNFGLALVHLCLDVIPYFLYCVVTFKRLSLHVR
jgi:hypothetical protein